MIKKLFSLQNIKYVISVDDCFFKLDEAWMRNELISQIEKGNPHLKTHFENGELKQQFNDIEEFANTPEAFHKVVEDFVSGLNMDILKRCCTDEKVGIVNENDETNKILEFLQEMKKDGTILDFKTISSVNEAENFNAENEGFTCGSILWLIDKSFENVGETESKGIELAKNKAMTLDSNTNFFYILTTFNGDPETEDEIESTLEDILSVDDEKLVSFIYYISKGKFLNGDTDKIAIALATGFKRRKCYELMNHFSRCLESSRSLTLSRFKQIDQRVLNYVFLNQVEEKGESYFDFFTRLVQIFNNDSYLEQLVSKRKEILNAINEYRDLLLDVQENVSDKKKVISILTEINKTELYDSYVNLRHSEIAPGDIFLIDGYYYVLVTQSCDTYLRKEFTRNLSIATLLKIKNNMTQGYYYPLACFINEDRNYNVPTVALTEKIELPFEILDLTVLNENGTAYFNKNIVLDDIASQFTRNYNGRLKIIINQLKLIVENKEKVDNYILDPKNSSNIEDIQLTFNMLLQVDKRLLDYSVKDSLIDFKIKRVARLNELNTISLINEYSNYISRVGLPFNFLES